MIEEVHRFPNGPIKLCGTLRWDVARLWEEMKSGLGKAATRRLPIRSVSVDSWAIDYVLMRRGEPLLRLPYNYRDRRTEHRYDAARELAEDELIFRCTGIQFMPINTLYQLIADLADDPELLRNADGFLLIADWFHFLLSGERVQEESNASTTQLYDPRARQWSARIDRDLWLTGAHLPESRPIVHPDRFAARRRGRGDRSERGRSGCRLAPTIRARRSPPSRQKAMDGPI